VLDGAAIERVDPLELVERDDDLPPAVGGEPPRQRKQLIGKARHVSLGPHQGKHDGQAAGPGAVLLEPDLRTRGRDRLQQPLPRAFPPRFDRGERPRVALEEGDVGAVSGHRQLDDQYAPPLERPQRLPHQRRLAVAPRRDQEDLLRGGEIRDEAVELVRTVGEGAGGYDLAVHERVLHGVTSFDVVITANNVTSVSR
jgi:hypothetical protein